MAERSMWNLISRYISKNCSGEEKAKLESWMRQDPSRRALVKELAELWEQSPEEDFEVDVQQAWERFQVRTSNKKTSATPSKQNRRLKWAWQKDQKIVFYRIAAAVLAVALISLFAWQYLGRSFSDQAKHTSVAMKKVVTKKGEKFQVTFSDGTVMTLNSSSSLRFPKKFKQAKREVYLKGEAYFNVTHTKTRPFIVHTPNAEIKVLGTKFNIQAWQDQKSIVGVREGLVSVGASSASDNLNKATSFKQIKTGQAITVDRARVGLPRKVNVDNLILWTGGGMYFNNASFSEVVHKIERTFNVNIIIKNKSLKDKHFTSTFKNADLSEILNIVSTSMGIRYSRRDSTIIFQ